MQLQYESETEVPEDLKKSFVEFKDGDKQVWMHKDLAETKKEAFRHKGDLTQAKQKQDEIARRLSEFEDREKQRLEEQERLEEESKLKNGQHSEIIEDLRSKLEEQNGEWQSKYNSLLDDIRKKEKAAVVNDLASAGTDKTRGELKRLINMDLTFDDDGNLIVLDKDGKATGTTIEEYRAKIKDLYPTLAGESHGKGGQSKSAWSGSGSAKKPSEMTSQERIEFKERDPEGFKRAFNL